MTIIEETVLYPTRMQYLKFAFKNQVVHLYNVHVPHNNVEASRLIKCLDDCLSRNHDDAPVVVCGDFNCVENETFDRERSRERRIKVVNLLQTLIMKYQLIDAYRFVFPEGNAMTYFDPPSHTDPKRG